MRQPRGGYILARPAALVSVADVIQAVDGPLSVTACGSGATEENCEQFAKCNVRDPLWKIKDRILLALAACSVAEMAADTIPEAAAPVTVLRRPTVTS